MHSLMTPLLMAAAMSGCRAGMPTQPEELLPLVDGQVVKMRCGTMPAVDVVFRGPKERGSMWEVEFPKVGREGRLILCVSVVNGDLQLHLLGYDHGAMALAESITLGPQQGESPPKSDGVTTVKEAEHIQVRVHTEVEEGPFGSGEKKERALRIDLLTEAEESSSPWISLWLVRGKGIVRYGRWSGNAMRVYERVVE